ncbi:hypothetical protein CJ030_MR1G008462 [Morella rubra]|uniref:Cotton fiber protein n=1 Tax=Morella rubra TaxID=262757 RepID=A0A6A1WN04_9ROSI|nr:hypothetical protein CJ030_MR1G008462 [Morella rubra]
MVGPLQTESGSSSTLSSTKIKTLIHTLIFSHVCRIIRALSKAKTILIEVLRKSSRPHRTLQNKNKKYRNKKLFVGSFRLHYNWCSSHVVPVPAPVLDEASKAHLYCDSHTKERVGVPDQTHLYYDSTWNSVLSTEQGEDCGESQLSGYLQWLEEKVHDDSTSEKDLNEIDKLAERFIASCHEKFRLEKEESYRRFQEMMTRSM